MSQNRKNDFNNKKAVYWEKMTKSKRGLFSISPIIASIIVIAIVIGAYYYILKNNYFPEYQLYFYYAVKIIIAFQILGAAARTLLMPILALATGIGLFLADKFYQYSFIDTTDCWQLIILAIVSFLITIIVKL